MTALHTLYIIAHLPCVADMAMFLGLGVVVKFMVGEDE